MFVLIFLIHVADWPPFGKKADHLVDHRFSLYFNYLQYYLFPIFVLRVGVRF